MGNIQIDLVSNGIVLTRDNPNDDGTINEVFPLELGITRHSVRELNELRVIMYTLAEALGYSGSKHDEYRLRFVVEHQHPSEQAQEVLNGASESFDYPGHCLIWEVYE